MVQLEAKEEQAAEMCLPDVKTAEARMTNERIFGFLVTRFRRCVEGSKLLVCP